ncbi:hypothetical protein K3727_09070 [Rhodobacteraceae bacterium M382]|nr:hypothetical protein K3727_09070 [Rhodobacteraceae bacterium M382]
MSKWGLRSLVLATGMAGLGLPVIAQEGWTPALGEEIRSALEGRSLIYDRGAWQDFNASGRTLYNAGRDSWGYWAVRDDRYCSMWPPSDIWACYKVEVTSTAVRFVDPGGEITTGTYRD